mmetsp:Transcript_67433/g.163122  ORF Transcript_67433/g.163122 Transcript_67433/m.163122 type:complete len:306 (-) Transcript_67433:241-1158(-)
MVERASRSCASSLPVLASPSPMAVVRLACCFVFCSSCTLRSLSSLSRRSLRRASMSPSVCLALSCSLSSPISTFFCRFFWRLCSTRPISWSSCSFSCWIVFCASSLRRVSVSRTLRSSSTVLSCPSSPAPFSTSRCRLAISALSFWIVSLAFTSFSWLTSTIFQAFSICFFSPSMVRSSSSLNLSAVETFAALFTSSVFSSRTFFISRFFWSWLLRSARCSFSYSRRNRSSERSSISSLSTSWNSFSSCSNAEFSSASSMPRLFSRALSSAAAMVAGVGVSPRPRRCPRTCPQREREREAPTAPH